MKFRTIIPGLPKIMKFTADTILLTLLLTGLIFGLDYVFTLIASNIQW